MKKSSRIYVALLVFVALGSVVEVVVEGYDPTATTWSGAVQGFVTMLLIYRWESADAVERGCRHSGVAKLVTIFLPPVGHGIHLYQSRERKPATWLFVRYWAGYLATALAAVLIAQSLVDPSSVTNSNQLR